MLKFSLDKGYKLFGSDNCSEGTMRNMNQVVRNMGEVIQFVKENSQ